MNETTMQARNIETDKRPFFSIIMPLYNAAPFLRDSIGSIQAQDFNDWELIMVDDKSSDDSVTIAKEFSRGDGRIKVYTSERNSGGAYTPRLRAASFASAPYVVTVDADDKISSDLLSSLHEQIEKGGTDLVIPELWRWNGGLTNKTLPTKTIDTNKIWNGPELVAHTLVNWEIPLCGFAVRRHLYLEADSNLSDNDRKVIFSDELHSRWLLFLSKSVAFCSGRYYYRKNDQSVTHTNLPRVIRHRLQNDDALIAMTDKAFGTNAPTYFRALENKLYSTVELLRNINNSHILTHHQKTEALKTISASMKGFDLQPLKGKTSPRYLSLMRLPIPLARIALNIIDSITGKKNGI